jgi:hypothetical protein
MFGERTCRFLAHVCHGLCETLVYSLTSPRRYWQEFFCWPLEKGAPLFAGGGNRCRRSKVAPGQRSQGACGGIAEFTEAKRAPGQLREGYLRIQTSVSVGAYSTNGDIEFRRFVISRSPVRIRVLAVINGQQLALILCLYCRDVSALILPLIARASFKDDSCSFLLLAGI